MDKCVVAVIIVVILLIMNLLLRCCRRATRPRPEPKKGVVEPDVGIIRIRRYDPDNYESSKLSLAEVQIWARVSESGEIVNIAPLATMNATRGDPATLTDGDVETITYDSGPYVKHDPKGPPIIHFYLDKEYEIFRINFINNAYSFQGTEVDMYRSHGTTQYSYVLDSSDNPVVYVKKEDCVGCESPPPNVE